MSSVNFVNQSRSGIFSFRNKQFLSDLKRRVTVCLGLSELEGRPANKLKAVIGILKRARQFNPFGRLIEPRETPMALCKKEWGECDQKLFEIKIFPRTKIKRPIRRFGSFPRSHHLRSACPSRLITIPKVRTSRRCKLYAGYFYDLAL